MKKKSTLFLKLTFLVVALFTTKISFTQTVYDIIQGSPNHTTLKAAIDVAGLTAGLKDANADLTVFAPTNAAFTAALTSLGITAADLLASADLKNILLYHVLGAEVFSSSLSNGQIAQPLNTANTVKVTLDGSKVFINQAEVTAADLNATNGVVHVLDAILLPSETVADLAIGSAAHTTLVAAVIEAKLLPALTDPFSELTVFAPTDAAFTAALTNLGITAADLLASADLKNILLYHVLGAEVLSSSLTNGQIAQPLNATNTVKVTIDGSKVYINQAEVTAADLTTDNGVVHVLDAILLPGETVADIAIGSAAHTTLVAAVIEARLLPALTDPFSELTVFAPTDAAFTAALTNLGITAADLLASADLQDILLYHVLGAEVLSTNLSNGQIAQPLNATNTVKVTIDGSKVYINQAEVSAADLTADNGVVHVLNSVLLPSETVADIAIGSAAHTTLVAAVIEAKLLPALTNPFSELTVFAPTDAAFSSLATTLGVAVADILKLPNLRDILLNHVVDTALLSKDLKSGTVKAINGVNLTIDLTSGVMVNKSKVTTADLVSDNGVVHVIDAVITGPLNSLEKVMAADLSMYPNPTTDFINVTNQNNAGYSVINVNGAVVANGVVSNSSIDVTSLSKGVYTLRIMDGETLYLGRFIKK